MNWDKHIGAWYKIPAIKNLVSSSYMKRVLRYLNNEYDKKIIYPIKSDVFKCFKLCEPKNLKVIILGQEPYCNHKSTGLAYANSNLDITISHPLSKIKENVEKTVYKGFNLDFDQSLESWAKQGVLLLNTSLTVEYNNKSNHFKIWNSFTKNILKNISINNPGIIIVVWGKHNEQYITNDLYDLTKICNIIKATHPASINKHDSWVHDNFNEINKIIEKQNGKEFCIKW